MYQRFFFLLLISGVFFSCEKQKKNEEKKNEISFSPAVINISNPVITLLDTCPKPVILVVPTKGSVNYTIPTISGPQTIILSAPRVVPLTSGEAGGVTFMQNYNTEQGLALSYISCGYSDRNGNLWFGTSGGGVSRYDGKSFTNFTLTQGLAGMVIKSITEDRSGNLWFGTNGGGVSKYNGKYFTSFSTTDGLADNFVKSIIEDKAGNIWFGTDGGVSKYTPAIIKGAGEKSFTNYTTTQGLVSNYVTSSIEDKSGNIWFGTSAGLSKYDGKSFTNFTTDQGLAGNNIMGIVEGKNGTIWFGTRSGMSEYNPVIKDGKSKKIFTNYTTTQGMADNDIRSISKDKEGNIWIPCGGGVSRYNPSAKSLVNYTKTKGLTNNAVNCITEDKTGNLWFGTVGDGLNKFGEKSFKSFTADQGLIPGLVWSITEDTVGNIWFGSSIGISKYDGKSFSNIGNDMVANVRSIIIDKMGGIWIGGRYGICKYDGKSFSFYGPAQGLINKGILSIIEDKNGNLWIGTYGNGAYKYDGKTFTNFTTNQGLANNIVKCITEDKKGNIWLGTNGGGVSKYDPSDKIMSFTNYTMAQGLANNTILSCIEDKAGNLWFGTSGGGLSKYNPSAMGRTDSGFFTNYTTTEGLADDMVYAIIEDTINGMLWCGTNLGLSGLKLNSISKEGSIAKFENFNNNNGYSIKDINTGALFIDSKGIIWAGTSDKLVQFNYKAIHKSTEPPRVFIQALKIKGEKICWNNLKSDDPGREETNEQVGEFDSLALLNEEAITFGHLLSKVQRDVMHNKFNDIKFDGITRFYPLPENLVLPFKHNNITFDFAAIETGKPQLVRYQYILEGYDNDWSPVSDKTSATFGNIHEGKYTFKLKAQSPDGVWSEPIIYTFKVMAPWYRTWWIYLSYIFSMLSIVLLFFRWRTASLRKEKEILEHTVKERTIEVVEQKELIEEKQKEIVASINYAKRIQYTLLANDELLQQNLKEYFVLFQPKDIVSGDFYWATSVAERFYLAICDSTGHGVPGAFMSLLNISFLNEAITEKHIKQPHEILNHVRQRLIESVSQDGAQDGMDGILLCIEFPSPEFIPTKEGESDGRVRLTYAAANNAPVIVRDNSIINLPADKMPIGKGEKINSFTLHTIETKKGDMLYFYSDGYADQFGGPKGKKFKNKQMEEVLISINKKSMEEQKQILAATIGNWKGNLEQVDDILIIGMRKGHR